MQRPNSAKVSPRAAVDPAAVIPAVDLELSIRTEKESYFVGEPIYLGVHLRNTSRETKRVMGLLHPDDGAISVHVAAADGARRRYAPLANVDNDSTAYRELAGIQGVIAIIPVRVQEAYSITNLRFDLDGEA